MPGLECPHCGYYANFRHRWRIHPSEVTEAFGEYPISACYTCDRCQYPVAATLLGFTDEWEEYWPKPGANGKEFPDVPKAVATAASEAHLCLTARSPRGAVALARAVVESVAKNKGITTGRLQGKIDKLYENGHISEAMKEAAHEIRFAGNEVAHGDLVAEPLSIEDASEIVTLMDAILERVYQEPAQVARIRQQREARKSRPAQVPIAPEDEPPF